MPERCGRTFDETLLTGYVDGTLTQGDEQRVRVHLEDCAVCRTAVSEMAGLRQVAMSSRFKLPSDTEWSESPRSGASRLSFGLGWLLLTSWGVAIAAFAVADFWRTRTPVDLEDLLAFGGVAGVALLFLGVLLDRLKALRADRYREVRK